MWQPIETAPKDNKIPLFLARFNDDGTIQSFDYNASWERESESWEMPGVYYYWASENGYVEEPTHWMYQPDWFNTIPGAHAQSTPSVNEGVRKVTLGFRWESEAQHHIPTIEIEFDPVSPESPNDAKGWQDRDRIASRLSPEAKP